MIGTTRSGISEQLRELYWMYSCCMNVAIYKWKVHNEKIEIISFEFVTYHRVCNKGDSKVPPRGAGTGNHFKAPPFI